MSLSERQPNCQLSWS